MSVEDFIRELRKLTAAERSAVLQHLLELEKQETAQLLHETADSPAQGTAQLERIESQVKQLSPAQQEALSDWLENLLEDRLEMTEEFKAKIERGEEDIRAGRVRIRKP